VFFYFCGKYSNYDKMKKFILFLLFMASSLTVLIARPVDLQTTVLAATKFASMQFSLQRGETPKLAYTGRYDAFYVFNIGPNGFVIISSDDALIIRGVS
jgi:hypothetical protein